MQGLHTVEVAQIIMSHIELGDGQTDRLAMIGISMGMGPTVWNTETAIYGR